MSLAPLPLLILLVFIAVVLAALFLWFLLTLGSKPPRRLERRAEPESPAIEPVGVPQSNDDYRGAAVQSKKRPLAQSDAFEKFIRSTKDELDF